MNSWAPLVWAACEIAVGLVRFEISPIPMFSPIVKLVYLPVISIVDE